MFVTSGVGERASAQSMRGREHRRTERWVHPVGGHRCKSRTVPRELPTAGGRCGGSEMRYDSGDKVRLKTPEVALVECHARILARRSAAKFTYEFGGREEIQCGSRRLKERFVEQSIAAARCGALILLQYLDELDHLWPVRRIQGRQHIGKALRCIETRSTHRRRTGGRFLRVSMQPTLASMVGGLFEVPAILRKAGLGILLVTVGAGENLLDPTVVEPVSGGRQVISRGVEGLAAVDK